MTGLKDSPMSEIEAQARACRDAAQIVAGLDSAARRTLLLAMAQALEVNAGLILAGNARDLAAAREKGIGSAMLDRLALDPARLFAMAEAVREVAALPDPVGQITRDDVRPNGIRVQKVRVPLGVIAMIYEARPNVTAEAAALCLKAGNGVILRGGSEAIHSNTAIAQALAGALQANGVPAAAVTVLTDLRREAMLELLQLHELIDLAIPRGGEGLIRFVAEHARVPVIKHYKGVCHVYVDETADLDLAKTITLNSKLQRVAVCNAAETLLVNRSVA
uniref:glutamate-5-semialdehyde dehydrogenase n=1 Tax=Stenotrophomonas sp. TaxID=69392 RepID=UPI00374DA532